MEEKVIDIPNINCAHCVRTIERELQEVTGVIHAEASAETRQVRVQWNPPATWPAIRQLLVEIDYPPQES